MLLLGENLVLAFNPVTDWGVAFGDAGTQPRGNVDANTLAQFNAVFIGNPNDKVLYLTFDAGYENGYTDKLLDTLKNQQVHATFFLVGNFIQRNPDLTRRMAAEGHTVGNHTFHHYNVNKIYSPEDFKKELKDLEDLFYETTGTVMAKFYRPPEGKFNERNLTMAQEMGYTTFFWSLAYLDWDNNAQPSQQTAFSKLIPRTHNGAVVLLHCTSKTNSEILDGLITQWKHAGYTFGNLADLAKTIPPK